MRKPVTKIWHHGEPHDVIDRMRFGGRTLYILERMGSRQRPVLRAYDRGLTGQMRCVHLLPYSPSTIDRLRTLSRVSAPHTNWPSIIESRRQGDQVVVLTKWIGIRSFDQN